MVKHSITRWIVVFSSSSQNLHASVIDDPFHSRFFLKRKCPVRYPGSECSFEILFLVIPMYSAILFAFQLPIAPETSASKMYFPKLPNGPETIASINRKWKIQTSLFHLILERILTQSNLYKVYNSRYNHQTIHNDLRLRYADAGWLTVSIAFYLLVNGLMIPCISSMHITHINKKN